MRPQRVTDLATGEVRYALVQLPRRQHIGGFFMAIQEGFRHLARLDLTGREHRVLSVLMSELDFDNWIRVPQSDIAKELNLDRSNVSRAVARLVELGVIHRGPKVGNVFTYRLDPALGWKGRAARRTVALDDFRRERAT